MEMFRDSVQIINQPNARAWYTSMKHKPWDVEDYFGSSVWEVSTMPELVKDQTAWNAYRQWRASFYFVKGGHALHLFTSWVNHSCFEISFDLDLCIAFYPSASFDFRAGQNKRKTTEMWTPYRKMKFESATTENTRGHETETLGAIRRHVGAFLHLLASTWPLSGPILDPTNKNS